VQGWVARLHADVGITDGGDLATLASRYADDGVHTTSIGVGVDSRTDAEAPAGVEPAPG
jgi:hypothetical protein